MICFVSSVGLLLDLDVGTDEVSENFVYILHYIFRYIRHFVYFVFRHWYNVYRHDVPDRRFTDKERFDLERSLIKRLRDKTFTRQNVHATKCSTSKRTHVRKFTRLQGESLIVY